MNFFQRFVRYLRRKSAPMVVPASSGVPNLDAFRRLRQPSATDLVGELKSTAWSCATINAAVCASLPPRLYVTTAPGQPRPLCATRALTPDQAIRLKALTSCAHTVEEVVDHPLLTLLRQVNPTHNAFQFFQISIRNGIAPDRTESSEWLLPCPTTSERATERARRLQSQRKRPPSFRLKVYALKVLINSIYASRSSFHSLITFISRSTLPNRLLASLNSS